MQPIGKSRNPFINSLHVPYTEVIKTFKIIDGKEQIDNFEYENEPHHKVYNSKSKREFIYSTLSMYARDMLTAIQYFTTPNKQYVILSYEKMQELLQSNMYGKRRYEDTVRELIRENIIDYKDKENNQFWYNPIYYSPSNRLKLFEECKVKTQTIKL
jgi:hypothetical protein